MAAGEAELLETGKFRSRIQHLLVAVSIIVVGAALASGLRSGDSATASGLDQAVGLASRAELFTEHKLVPASEAWVDYQTQHDLTAQRDCVLLGLEMLFLTDLTGRDLFFDPFFTHPGQDPMLSFGDPVSWEFLQVDAAKAKRIARSMIRITEKHLDVVDWSTSSAGRRALLEDVGAAARRLEAETSAGGDVAVGPLSFAIYRSVKSVDQPCPITSRSGVGQSGRCLGFATIALAIDPARAAGASGASELLDNVRQSAQSLSQDEACPTRL